MLEVAQQTQELEAYAAQYFEYAALVEGAGEVADEIPPPAIPPPFLRWLEFLLHLESKLKTNPELTRTLRADTAAGLGALEAARARFSREHKQCPGCGRFVIRAAGNCSCGHRFGRR
jgi:hypothetical protein